MLNESESKRAIPRRERVWEMNLLIAAAGTHETHHHYIFIVQATHLDLTITLRASFFRQVIIHYCIDSRRAFSSNGLCTLILNSTLPGEKP